MAHSSIPQAVIVSACRTPIGDFCGALSAVSAVDLGTIVGRAAIARAGLQPDAIDELLCGNVIQAGNGGNPARQIQAALGIPWDAPAVTINQLCASAMRACAIGAADIIRGEAATCLIIGTENMSRAPHLLVGMRAGYRMGPQTSLDALLHDALHCSISGGHMGCTAENIARRFNISRQAQDAIAARSHARASAAIRQGLFDDELVPVPGADAHAAAAVTMDEHVRSDTTPERLARLRPAFDPAGTVTAGNASGVKDGAAALVLMSADEARRRQITPLARVVSCVNAGVSPDYMGLGPARAIPRALQQAGLKPADIDCFEINEAFAAQYLGVIQALHDDYGIDLDQNWVNPCGSGIALGHPVGSTGARILVTLCHFIRRAGLRRGCASLCAGGGPAMATIIENGL